MDKIRAYQINRILFIILFLNTFILAQKHDKVSDSLRNHINSLSDSGKVSFLADYSWGIRESNTQLAIDLAKEGLAIAEKNKSIKDISVLSGYIGVYLIHYKHKPRESIPYIHIARENANIINDTVQIAYSYNNLGDAFFKTYNIPLALEYSYNSIELFEKIGHKKGIAYGQINLGMIYRLDKQYSKSLNYFQKSLELRESIGDSNGVAYSLLEIGRSYVYLNELDSAKKYLDESLHLHEKIKNLVYMAFCYNSLAEIDYKLNNYNSALKLFKTALELNMSRDYSLGIINNKLGIGLVYSKLGRISEGEQELSEAKNIAEKLGLSDIITEVHRVYVNFYKNVGDFESASSHLVDFVNTYDTLISNLTYDTFMEIGNRVSTEANLRKAEENLAIRKKAELYLYVILTLLVLLILLLIWRYRSNVILNNKLTQAILEKEKLFSIISHDLKNPFLALKGYVALLQEEPSKSESDEIIKNLDSITNRTYSLLENLLNLSSAKMDNLVFEPQKFLIEPLLDNILELLKLQISSKGLIIQKSLDSDKIYADIHMIEIIIRNILSNAIKYSNKGQKIILKVWNDETSSNISIKDEGIGIDSELAAELFKSEAVESTTGTAGEKGTGLGLNLCSFLIKKHGGTIKVISENGKGSNFVISLPNEKV